MLLSSVSFFRKAKFLCKPDVGRVNTDSLPGQILVRGVQLFWDSPAARPDDPAEGAQASVASAGGVVAASNTGGGSSGSSGGGGGSGGSSGRTKIPLLADVDFEVGAGQLCVVIGRTGAGKSGLMSALIGDLPVEKGVVAMNGSIAYAAQTPWIQVSKQAGGWWFAAH